MREESVCVWCSVDVREGLTRMFDTLEFKSKKERRGGLIAFNREGMSGRDSMNDWTEQPTINTICGCTCSSSRFIATSCMTTVINGSPMQSWVNHGIKIKTSDICMRL